MAKGLLARFKKAVVIADAHGLLADNWVLSTFGRRTATMKRGKAAIILADALVCIDKCHHPLASLLSEFNAHIIS
jgi:hypothetical protein